MIFNISPSVNTYKTVAIEQNDGLVVTRPITQLSLEDRDELVRIYSKAQKAGVTLTDIEKMEYASEVMDHLSNSYQDAYEHTPYLVIGKTKVAALKRSCPFFDAMVDCLEREEWKYVVIKEDSHAKA